MSRRSRKHRKRFTCGHRGFGKYCHCCAKPGKLQQAPLVKVCPAEPIRTGTEQVRLKQAACAARRAKRQQWQALFCQDVIDLRQLPKAIVVKARSILAALSQGVGYWQVGGKRLVAHRDAIRIPLTPRYRLLCRQEGATLIPLQVVSHEDYNPLVRRSKRLFATFFSRGSVDR